MLHYLKNRIKTSQMFWRYRHFVDPFVWQSYYADYHNKRRSFYAEYMKKQKMRSVFEFGCASGPNLRNILQHFDNATAHGSLKEDEPVTKTEIPLVILGYDINRYAIKLAQTQMHGNGRMFVDKLRKPEIVTFLSDHGIDHFDLAIYDRVLYLLEADEVENHFAMFAAMLEKVVIDDFHNTAATRTNGAYATKNYATILGNHGFELHADEPSEHIANEPFFKKYARRLTFKKNGNRIH